MSTFCAVDDETLIAQIQGARKRIVFIAPGVHEPVAKALVMHLSENDGLDVTVVLDPDEEVCRIGFGDVKGLELIHKYAGGNHFAVKSQLGLRVGVLLADDTTLIWSPTPRSVEAPPISTETQAIKAKSPSSPSKPEAVFPHQSQIDLPMIDPSTASVPPSSPVPEMAPNGLLLGANPGNQLAKAVAADGTETDPKSAEIGKSAITPEQLKATKDAIDKNPIIPVDLARVTRVFSTKLQFVELKIEGAKISSSQLTLSSDLLNADAKGDLQELIKSKLSAFSAFKTVEVEVPAYLRGEALEGKSDKVSEATLQRTRTNLERRFLYDITGYGRLVAKDEKIEFEAEVEALKVQLLAHSKEIKKKIKEQSEKIIDDAVELIMDRAKRSDSAQPPDKEKLRKDLKKDLTRGKEEDPKITLVFKDITYEQTKSGDFRKRVEKALPAHKRTQLGKWSEHFDAAREAEKTAANKANA